MKLIKMYLSHAAQNVECRVIAEVSGETGYGLRAKYRINQGFGVTQNHYVLNEFVKKKQPGKGLDHIVGYNAWVYKTEGSLDDMLRILGNIRKQLKNPSEIKRY